MKHRFAISCAALVVATALLLGPAAVAQAAPARGEAAEMASWTLGLDALRAGLHELWSTLWSKVLPLDPLGGVCPGDGGGGPSGQIGSMIDPDG